MSTALFIAACLAACGTGCSIGLALACSRAGLDTRQALTATLAFGAALVLVIALLVIVRASGASA